jgi:hypothetical protein
MRQNRRKYCTRLIAIIDVKRMIFDAPLPGNSVVAAYTAVQFIQKCDTNWLRTGLTKISQNSTSVVVGSSVFR